MEGSKVMGNKVLKKIFGPRSLPLSLLPRCGELNRALSSYVLMLYSDKIAQQKQLLFWSILAHGSRLQSRQESHSSRSVRQLSHHI